VSAERGIVNCHDKSVSLSVRIMIYYQRHTQNFRRNRDGVGKEWLSAYKSSNISETRQDMTKVLLRSNRKSHTAFDWCQSQRPRM